MINSTFGRTGFSPAQAGPGGAQSTAPRRNAKKERINSFDGCGEIGKQLIQDAQGAAAC
jgi:hypothetical protein